MHPSPGLLKPLMFKCTMEKHKPAKNCIFFRLPDELLACVVQDLAESFWGWLHFKSLALVNSDFRQLVRAYRFRVVTLDGSQARASRILSLLMSEAFERQQNRRVHGQTKEPSLGACIRRVVVKNPRGLGELTAARNPLERLRPGRPTGLVIDAYRDHVLHRVLSSLPNLEVLDLSEVTLGQNLLDSLVGSAVRRVTMDANTASVCPYISPGVSWPITILTLRLSVSVGCADDLSSYWANILRLCAPTLEQLTMSHSSSQTRGHLRRVRGLEHRRRNPLCFDLKFPELTHLDIKWAEFLDQSALRSLLSETKKLQYLSIDCTSEAVREVMNKSNEFVGLRTMVVSYRSIYLNEIPRRPLKFTENMRYITSFAFTGAAPWELSRQILEGLRHFPWLERLMMMWDNNRDPEPLLTALSSSGNASLEELYLITDDSGPHAPILQFSRVRKVSSSLRKLKCLVLSSWRSYLSRAEAVPKWYITSRGRLRTAVRYAMVFPNLELVRLWGRSINIERNEARMNIQYSRKEFKFPFAGHFDAWK